MRLWPILKASHSPLIFYYTGILVTIAKIKYCYQDINFTFYWHFERDHQDMTDLEQKKRWQMREYSEKNLSKNHLTVWYGQSSLQTSIQTYVWHLHLNYLSRIIFQIINIFSIISYSVLFIYSMKLYQPCKTDRWSKDLQNLFSHFKI